MTKVSKWSTAVLAGCLVLAGCGVPNVTVTVKGKAIGIDKYNSGLGAGKTKEEAFTAALRTGAVAFASVAPTSKGAATGADGAFSFTFKALPKSTFRVQIDGDTVAHAELFPAVFTVPDTAGKPAEIDVGVIAACNVSDPPVMDNFGTHYGYKDAMELMTKQGYAMIASLAKTDPPAGETGSLPSVDVLVYAGNTELTVDNGFEITVASRPPGAPAVVVTKTNVSGSGRFVITKKDLPPEGVDVTLSIVDKNTTAPRPFTYGTMVCPVKPGWVSDCYLRAK